MMIANKGTYHRFAPERWCNTRRLIHRLKTGQRVILHKKERNNALASVQRISAAYSFQRQYRVLKFGPVTFQVRRVK